MKHYTVCTPEYEHFHGSVFLMDEPPDYGADCVDVEAQNRREARKLAIKSRELFDWVQDQRSSNMNPFTGLQVFDTMCPHGKCWCSICSREKDWSECEECLKEWEAENDNGKS